MKIIWDKKNKITRMVSRQEYVDPRQDFSQPGAMLHKKILREDKPEDCRHDDNKARGKTSDYIDTSQINLSQINISQINKNQIYKKNQIDINQIDESQIGKSQISKSQINKSQISKSQILKGQNTKDEINEEDNPTCLLNDVISTPAKLVLKSIDEANYNSINITDFPFFIGKLKKNVDYCLEKEVISRYHAKITKEDGEFYLTDLNSTNGTFVNQCILQTYEKRQITTGDEIAFANIKYELRQE